MISLISRLVRPRPPAVPVDLDVTLYTRVHCCCCHTALDVLEAARAKHGFRLHEVDVDSDPALVALHDAAVPVVAVNGKVRFKGVVNPVLLDRIIAAEGRPARL